MRCFYLRVKVVKSLIQGNILQFARTLMEAMPKEHKTHNTLKIPVKIKKNYTFLVDILFLLFIIMKI